MVALAFLCSFLVFDRLVKSLSLSKEAKEISLDLFLFAFLFGIIGARAWFCFLEFDYYKNHFGEIFQIWQGGQSIQGGLILGLLSGLVFYFWRKNKFEHPGEIADKIAIVLPLGQSIGRLGNFFNQEAFGTPSKLPWALYVCPEKRPFGYLGEESFHPTFFYEAICLLGLFCLMILLDSRKNKLKIKAGSLICFYLIFYSLIRFFLEYLRLDSLYLLGFPAAQVVCILLVLFNLGAVFLLYSKPSR